MALTRNLTPLADWLGPESAASPVPDAIQSALALAGVGCCRVSRIGRPVYLDTVATAVLKAPSQLSIYALLRRIEPASRHALIAAVRRILAADDGARQDGPLAIMVRDDDALLYIDVALSVTRDGDSSFLLATVIDRTVEREEIAHMRKRNEHLWRTVDLNPQLPWLAEQDKGVTVVTDRYLKLVGLKEEEALGFLGWMKVIHPDDLERMQATVGRAMMVGEATDVRLRFKVASGEYRWMRSQCFPLRDEAGTVVQWYGYTEDIHEIVLQEIETRWAAEHDPLTALPNRTLFNRRLDEVIAHAALDMSRVGLMVLDLDHFKDVNDLFGHDAGDRLLTQFAKVLQNSIFVEATIARLGGDEFAVMLPNLESPKVMEELIEAIFTGLKTPIKLDGRDFDCRASAGWAIFPTQANNASELFKHADIALYEAKNTGRSRYMAFEPKMKNAMQRRVAMINLGREAVENGRLLPYYQPQYSLETGEVLGFEALLRRRDRSGAICLPGTIYEAFQDFEVAEAIGINMLSMIVSDMAMWRAQGLDFGVMSINASTAEFRNRDFIQRLIAHADGAGIPRNRFCVEINEDVFVGRAAPLVSQMILELKQEGFGISLDDFGTGYASLTHLREIPVDALKIDRSFIMDLFGETGNGNDSGAIVSAIIKLGHSLGMTVVAEGVETRRQATFLKRHGCTIGQGFLFGYPSPAEVVTEMLVGARKSA